MIGVFEFADRRDRTRDVLHLSPLAPWQYKTVCRDYYFDISKARDLLRWEPTDGAHEMFERAYDWYRANDIEGVDEEGSVHRTAPKQKALAALRKLS